ncbi:MAG: hypothetical protein JW775_10115 [Candidatus Aminicenantes bacterium]|nr:hypothetical protein [Candidatus Aminicenantes bacterium]
MSLNRVRILFAVALSIGLLSACDEPRSGRYLMSESRTVELDGAARAEVKVNMGAGELRLHGAAQTALLEASFEFNRERNRPEVDYRLFGDKGILEVRHARRRGINFGTTRNRWDLVLGEAVPLDLAIDLGAGQSDIDLRGLDLERVEIDMGVGEMELDLRGPRQAGLLVKIDGGIGSGKLRLPSEVGVRVKVDGGLGSVDAHGLTKQAGAWVNDAYGRSPVTIEVDIDAGIGSLDLRSEPANRIRT